VDSYLEPNNSSSLFVKCHTDFLISSIYELFHKDEAEISALYEEAANATMCPRGVNKSGHRGKGMFKM